MQSNLDISISLLTIYVGPTLGRAWADYLPFDYGGKWNPTVQNLPCRV